MTPDEVTGAVQRGLLSREQAMVHFREHPGLGPVARMIIDGAIAGRGTVYELPGVIATVRPSSVSSGPAPVLHEERPGWHSLAELNPDGSSRVIPGGPVAPAATVIGECRGCGLSEVLDGCRLCRYCAELASLKATAEKLHPAVTERAWPWPLSARSLLARFWLVFALLAIGALIGVLG